MGSLDRGQVDRVQVDREQVSVAARRVADWPSRLAEVIEAWRDRPFVWGQSDCLHLCIACERAITGASRFDGLPPYDSEASAARGLVALGHRSVMHLVDARLQIVGPPSAQRGDWVMRTSASLMPGALGVVVGEQAVHMGVDGRVFLPVISAARGWRV